MEGVQVSRNVSCTRRESKRIPDGMRSNNIAPGECHRCLRIVTHYIDKMAVDSRGTVVSVS